MRENQISITAPLVEGLITLTTVATSGTTNIINPSSWEHCLQASHLLTAARRGAREAPVLLHLLPLLSPAAAAAPAAVAVHAALVLLGRVQQAFATVEENDLYKIVQTYKMDYQ